MENLKKEIKLTPSSSAEDILKASPEERRRLAEDIARQSNAFATSEICKELYEELCRELYQERKKTSRSFNEKPSKSVQTQPQV